MLAFYGARGAIFFVASNYRILRHVGALCSFEKLLLLLL